MRYKKFDETIVVRLETGEDIHASIREICKNENVTMGTITGFGGINYIKVGIWNNETNGYDYKIVNDRSMELLSLTGNISMLNGEVNTHIHVAASDNTFNVFGGHLVDGIVQNLAELYIYPGNGRIDRIPVRNWNFMDI
ncbi:DNA-binding protein [Clostridium sp. SHJSY1]|uniref:PPC domain-containing DNA-binding protein n=1 Tax=Clostridium sp. SHJSY1 TaxID=2942483 RepID=UPI0028768B1F|nr:DNA-binding protein [Clostridium sp. SHJSY1]MDS0524295.1 DNA-binding protein [Clostridium sp. SHJSY1]